MLDVKRDSDRYRPCLAVYHECHEKKQQPDNESQNLIGEIRSYLELWLHDAYRVPGNYRGGGFKRYAGESRVLWDDFRYGNYKVADFIGLISGKSMPVPASYGKVPANFNRIDILSGRPFNKIYQNDCRTDCSLKAQIDTNMDLVVRYVVNPHVEPWSEAWLSAFVVKARQYANINWRKVERRYLGRSQWGWTRSNSHKQDDLPSEILCYGTVRDALSFVNFWQQKHQDGIQALDSQRQSTKWIVRISHPEDWRDWMCSHHGIQQEPIPDWYVEPYERPWENPYQLLGAIGDILNELPIISGYGGGAALGYLVEPEVALIVECSHTISWEQMTEYLGLQSDCISPAPTDKIVEMFIDQMKDTSTPMDFFGTLDKEQYRKWAGS